MAEELIIENSANKKEKYEQLVPQLQALVSVEEDLVANLANIAAGLKYGMGFFWVGFYLEKGDELVLGPFQGPVACTRIKPGKGVCGTAWAKNETIIVPNVDEFPGHIACSSESKSEIVLPLYQKGKLIGVLDIDSNKIDDFDEVDRQFLEKISDML